jgi:hypothetical protein
MGNTDSNPWIGITQEFQEIEKIRFNEDLRKNPDDYNRYVSERIDRITEETMDKKRAAFQKAHIDMGRYMDMDHNANHYKIRNRDVLGLQEQMVQKSRSVKSGIKHDKDLTRRQVEINEWYFGDKLETLFFLQLFFIVLLSEAIVLYLQKNNFITMPFAALLTFILFGVVTGVGLYRWRYTTDIRDSRFWNKRNFREKEIYVPKPRTDDCAKPVDFFPKELTDCAKKAEKAAEDAANATLGYISDSSTPYQNIALGAAAGVGLGATVVGASVIGGGALLANQALSDSRNVANRAGAAANRAATQLEKETVAYITGDNRVDPDPNAEIRCPF